MEYLTIQEMAQKWNLSERRLQAICASGRIEVLRSLDHVGQFRLMLRNRMINVLNPENT